MKALARSTLLAGAVAAALATPASAVTLSPDGTGQVLLFPYYTTRAGFTTSIAIVNQDMHHTKVVKVRWREGKIGAPVLDLNVFLPPRDVWTAVVSDDGNAARLGTSDRSCTNPAVPSAGLPFVNSFYTGQAPGAFDDGGGAGLDRTREGYVEVIEMGIVANGADFVSFPATPQGNTVAAAVRPGIAGTPSNCAAIRVANLFSAQGDLRAPAGGLSGQAIIVNLASGTEFATEPTALQHFFRPPDPKADLYSEPGSVLPDLASVVPARSDVVPTEKSEWSEASPAIATVHDWVAAGGQPIDAVSAVLMKNHIDGEYDVSIGIRSEMIVTMPTKRHYVLVGPADALPAGYVAAPFRESWLPLTRPSSCDKLYPSTLDRAGAPYATVTGVQFLQPTGAPAGLTTICGVSTAIVVVPNNGTVTNSHIFASATNSPLVLPANGSAGAAPQYSAGWISLGPTDEGFPAVGFTGQRLTGGVNAVTGIPVAITTLSNQQGLRNLRPVHSDGVARRYRGLPMIGFMAINGVFQGLGYGGIFPLRSRTIVEP